MAVVEIILLEAIPGSDPTVMGLTACYIRKYREDKSAYTPIKRPAAEICQNRGVMFKKGLNLCLGYLPKSRLDCWVLEWVHWAIYCIGRAHTECMSNPLEKIDPGSLPMELGN